MEILPDRVATPETLFDDKNAVLAALKSAGAKNPKVVLVFDETVLDKEWKLRVFYSASGPLQEVRLDEKMVLIDTKLQPDEGEVLKTIYPDGYVGYCTIIGGQRIWIT